MFEASKSQGTRGQTTGARAHAEVDRPVLVLFLRSFRDISRPYTYINLYIGTYYSKLYQVNLRGRCFNSFLLFLVSKASFQCRIFSVLHQTLQPMPHAIPSRVSKVITQTPWTIAMVPACSGNLRPAIRGVFLQKPLEAAGDNSAKDIRSRSCRDCRAQDMTRS